MTWCNINNPSTSSNINININNDDHINIPITESGINSKINPIHTISCPSCGHHIPLQDKVKLFNFIQTSNNLIFFISSIH